MGKIYSAQVLFILAIQALFIQESFAKKVLENPGVEMVEMRIPPPVPNSIPDRRAEGDIIPLDYKFIAIESKELLQEYKLLYMSEKELKKTREYKLYKYEKTNEFVIGIDNLLFFRAELFCRQHRFRELSSFEVEYVHQDRFEKGLAYQVGLFDDGYTVVTSFPRVKWDVLSKHGKKEFKSIGGKLSEYVPHLVFTHIYCAGKLPDSPDSEEEMPPSDG